MVHTNFGANSCGPIIGPHLFFLVEFVWTNGPESSSKVSPCTGIGPWMALPSLSLSEFTEFAQNSVSSLLPNISTSDFQSEVGEVFGKIGGELPAKFGRRFSSFFRWGDFSEAFSTKTPPQISPSNFTTRFWVAGPRNSTLETVFRPFPRKTSQTENAPRSFWGVKCFCAPWQSNSPAFANSCSKIGEFRSNVQNGLLFFVYSLLFSFILFYSLLFSFIPFYSLIFSFMLFFLFYSL